MPAGRPPKPTKLKIAAGNPGKRKLNAHEPKPSLTAPAMPKWMSAEAQVEWKRIVPELIRIGLLSKIDLASLAGYCQAFAELEIATRLIDAENRTVKQPILNPSGEHIGDRIKAHPAVAQQRQAAAMVKSFMAEFGLSPSSRSKVVAGDAPTASRGAEFFA